MEWLTNWFFDLLYSIQKSVCYIIDFIKDIFYTLSGVEPINFNGTETDILSNFLMSNVVKNAFLIITLIGVALLFVFVLIAIIRSEYTHGENKKSKGAILAKASHSFIIFLIVPFVLLAGIALSNTVVRAVNQSMNPYITETETEAKIGGQILVTCGYYAYIGDEAEREQIEKKFITGELDYTNTDIVSQYYKIRDLDFFVGLIGGLVILVMFVMSALTFIQRIFDIILLFLISPISVSTIPTDDGIRFKQWKEILIGKVLSAYGIILTMNLFFIIIPQVQQINFFNDAFKDGIIKILFIIGGAFAVTKANLVIANLTGSQTGGNETRELIANMRTGTHITRTVGTTALTLGGALLGGKHFVDGNKSIGFTGGIKSSFNTPVSKAVENNNNATKTARYAKMPTRIASMPLGVIKDFAAGGLVGVGKNFIPRMNNIVKGDTVFNHAQLVKMKTIEKEQTDENNT